MPNWCPGVVESYDAATRTCRVSIPGITEGSQELPVAVFNNPIGDRAGTTEIEIIPGDLVWLAFEGGDPRFPIVAGYRTPRAGNTSGWRRWHHANIQLEADGSLVLKVGGTTLTVSNGQVTISGADLVVSGDIKDQGGVKSMSGMRALYNAHVHGTSTTPSNSM